MTYSALWAKITLSKKLISAYLDKFDTLLNWKEDKETILDVGCADGSITKDIIYGRYRKHIKQLVGIDKLDGMIEHARNGNTIEEIDFVTMNIMDAEKVEKMRGKFDHIFTFYVAHWIPDNRTLLENFYNMLAPGGQVFITIMIDSPLHQSLRRLEEKGYWSAFAPVEQLVAKYTKDPIQYVTKLMADSGFKVEVCEHEQSVDVVEEFDDFVKAIVAMYKYIDNIPQDLQEEFLEYHVKYCFEQSTYIGEPSTFRISYHTLICIGSKSAI